MGATRKALLGLPGRERGIVPLAFLARSGQIAHARRNHMHVRNDRVALFQMKFVALRILDGIDGDRRDRRLVIRANSRPDVAVAQVHIGAVIGVIKHQTAFCGVVDNRVDALRLKLRNVHPAERAAPLRVLVVALLGGRNVVLQVVVYHDIARAGFFGVLHAQAVGIAAALVNVARVILPQARIEVAVVVHGNALQQTGDSGGIDDQRRIAIRIREAVRVAIGVKIGHQVLDARRRKLRVIVVACQGVIRLARVVFNRSQLVVSRFKRNDVVHRVAVVNKRGPSVFRIERKGYFVAIARKTRGSVSFKSRFRRQLRLHHQHRAPTALVVFDGLDACDGVIRAQRHRIREHLNAHGKQVIERTLSLRLENARCNRLVVRVQVGQVGLLADRCGVVDVDARFARIGFIRRFFLLGDRKGGPVELVGTDRGHVRKSGAVLALCFKRYLVARLRRRLVAVCIQFFYLAFYSIRRLERHRRFCRKEDAVAHRRQLDLVIDGARRECDRGIRHTRTVFRGGLQGAARPIQGCGAHPVATFGLAIHVKDGDVRRIVIPDVPVGAALNRLRVSLVARIAVPRLRELLVKKHRGLVDADGFELEAGSGQLFLIEIEMRLIVYQAQGNRPLVIGIGIVRVTRRFGRGGHRERF